MPQQLSQQIQGFMQFYWGGIGGTSGPPYLGAIVCFLALIGFVLLDGKHKWWILVTCIFTIIMSWGKYFEGFNTMVLNYLPMYNKFRAPSMILVVPTLLLSMLSILSLNNLLSEENRDLLFTKYKKGLLVVGSIFIVALLVYFTADFTSDGDKVLLQQINSISDAQQKATIEPPVRAFLTGIKKDRQTLFMGDLLRSFLFILVAAVAIFAYFKKKLNAISVTLIVGIFAFIDVMAINIKYLNADNFQENTDYENTFKPREVDAQILTDTGYYRVLDVSQGINAAFNAGALNSYFHKSVGGYHPAKLSIYQDLIEKQLYNFPSCLPVIDMLNTKYIITSSQQNGQKLMAQPNPEALGACWFVKAIDFKKNPTEVMNALTNFNPKDTSIIEDTFRANLAAAANKDSSSFIKMRYNDNDIIAYQSSSHNSEFAVFSEIYYDAGWVATIDGKESPIIRTNYVLRQWLPPNRRHNKFH